MNSEQDRQELEIYEQECKLRMPQHEKQNAYSSMIGQEDTQLLSTNSSALVNLINLQKRQFLPDLPKQQQEPEYFFV